MACCAAKKKKNPGLDIDDGKADERDLRERQLLDQQRQEMERAAQLKAEQEEAALRQQQELEAEAKQKELDLEASAFFREDQVETQETIIERHVLEEDQAIDYDSEKMLAMRALQSEDDDRALREQQEVEALLAQRQREADEAERQREVDMRNRQREQEEMDRRFEEQSREREAEERRRRLAEEEELRRQEEEDARNREKEMFNEEERLAVLRMIEEEETEHAGRFGRDNERGAAGGGDEEHYRLLADTKPLLEPPPGVSKAEPQRRSTKKEPAQERDYRKLLPWVCCLLLLLLALLLLGYLWWHPKEVAGAATDVSNAASNAAKGVGNAASNAAKGVGNAASHAAHEVGSIFKSTAPEVPTAVAGGSAILVDNAGPANGEYHEAVFSNGTTTWQNKDCAIKRTVVDVWDLECLNQIQCEKPLGAHLAPPPENGMVCKDTDLHPRLHTVHGVVHVTGNPTEDHVPGDYFEQPSNTNGKPWFKSERDCTIHWAKTTRTWELWCFSDRWCKKVVPLYMHSDDTPLPPNGKWFTQKGRAIGKGPVPTISMEELSSPEDAIKKEIENVGDLDEQKKAVAKAEAEAASEEQKYELHAIHI